MVQLFALLLAVGSVNLLFIGLQIVAFKVARFSVEQIGFGLPFLLKRRVNGTELKIGPVPILSFVYSSAWQEAPRAKRALIAIAPWLVIGCIPPLIIGPARAFGLELSIWPRLIEGALDKERAHALISGFSNLLRGDWIDAVSVVMALMVAVNLLPIPGVAGGHVLLALLGTRPEDRLSKVIAGVMWLLWFALAVCWLFWLLTFLFR